MSKNEFWLLFFTVVTYALLPFIVVNPTFVIVVLLAIALAYTEPSEFRAFLAQLKRS